MASFDKESAVAFTDGACKGNPGPAGSGVALRLPGGKMLTRSEYLGHATNNVAELTALSLAMEMASEEGFPITFNSNCVRTQSILTVSWSWVGRPKKMLI